MGFIPAGWEYWFYPNFTLWRLLAMAFVLGNFFTATADDLDHMASTRGFLKTWAFIAVIMFLVDAGNLFWNGYDFTGQFIPFVVKWVLLMVFCALSHMRIGILFRVATGDVLAMASAAALLSPLLIVLFFLIMKGVNYVERPFLRRFGQGDAYPFMPVVFTSFGLMLLLGLLLSGHLVVW